MDGILIVDDEIWVVEVIKRLIQWEIYGFQIIGFATNGIQALQLIEEKRPQVVFTDICMPEMGGVDFLSEISVQYQNILTVVISGYNDFDYAKAALTSGAIGYLLKPIDEEELRQIVLKARHILDGREKENQKEYLMKRAYDNAREELRQAFFEKILAERIIISEELVNKKLKTNFREGLYRLLLLFSFENDRSEDAELFGKEVWKEQLPAQCNEVILFEYKDYVICLINYESDKNGNFIIKNSIRNIMKRITDKHSDWLIWEGKEFKSIDELHEAYRNLEYLKYAHLIIPEERIFVEDEFSGIEEKRVFRQPDIVIKLSLWLNNGDVNETKKMAQKALDNVLSRAGKNPYRLYTGLQGLFMDLISIDETEKMADLNFNEFYKAKDIVDIRRILDKNIQKCFLYKTDREKNERKNTVERIQTYLETNYMNDISLDDIANIVNLSPGYLSD